MYGLAHTASMKVQLNSDGWLAGRSKTKKTLGGKGVCNKVAYVHMLSMCMHLQHLDSA